MEWSKVKVWSLASMARPQRFQPKNEQQQQNNIAVLN
jgi:hypothetical protein